ncbi:MAG: ArsC family reductase [Pseudomonadota bacterium]|nr:ArsC family reductase [Pseudomonadota bacterium]
MNAPALTLYGIANCDTVKKARAWLTARRVAHVFHDFKKQGVPADALAHWLKALGWDKVLNRQGTTWRKLAPGQQAAVRDAASAAAWLTEQPSAIKRPVVQWPDGSVSVGFAEADWARRLGLGG